MPKKQQNELVAFQRFLAEKLKLGGVVPSPEAVVEEWRQLHPVNTVSVSEDDLEAIQEALDDIDAGDEGMPFEEFKREFLAKQRLPS